MSLNLLEGNLEALELLDWSQITSNISILSHFEITKNKLKQAPKILSREEICFSLDQLESYLLKFDEYSLEFNSKFRTIPDGKIFFDYLSDLKKGKFFEARELNFFALLFELYHEHFSFFKQVPTAKSYDLNIDEIRKIRREFLNPLREFVDQSGETNYERHPLLRKLYAEVLNIENDIRNNIIKLSRSEPYSSRLQMDNFDIINDRYVLAIRSDSYHSDLGPIVARSQSGMTLFVEPYEVKDKANKRIHLLSEIESTILKLTIELSKTAFKLSPFFDLFAEWILLLDMINTKATYSFKLGLSKPIISSSFKFDLNGLYHPLLSHPIKNNLSIDKKHKGVVISGPNTGGKTVALKSLSISILFLHLGLYVPATYAELYPIDHLFYFSHDHQNLTQGLSSFASEAKYYLELLTHLGPNNLIIIDEIFNSTSSEEASALAIGLLEEIHRNSHAKIIISTHHQLLKTFMHQQADYLSAHVGFDFELNKPTYKLIVGDPGSSLAFKIFDNLSSRFGVSTQISEKAKSILDTKHLTYEALLQDLSSKKIELDKTLQTNKALNIELKNQKASMEGVLYLEKEKIIAEYTKKIKTLFDRAEHLFSDVKAQNITSKKALTSQITAIQSDLNKETNREFKRESFVDDRYSHYRNIEFDNITPGQLVFSLNFKKDVKVIQVNPRKKEIQIAHGPLSLWVKENEIKWPTSTKIVPKISIHVEKSIEAEIEIDCRGMRLEDFKKRCEAAIESIYSSDVPFVNIIHGHGDGILKNWLRDYLKKECRDLKFENIEGNDGCTKITMN